MPDAVIDQIAEDAFEPDLAALYRDDLERSPPQAVVQADLMIDQICGQLLQDRGDHVMAQVQHLLFHLVVADAGEGLVMNSSVSWINLLTLSETSRSLAWAVTSIPPNLPRARSFKETELETMEPADRETSTSTDPAPVR